MEGIKNDNGHTTRRADSKTPESKHTDGQLERHSMSRVLPEFKTQSCFSESGSPHHRQPLPSTYKGTLHPGWDRTSFQQQSRVFLMAHLAQSDFAQEMKKVQSGLDSWGLGSTERKGRDPPCSRARDKVPPEPAGPCHLEHKGHCQGSDF